jgi:hypothetical protein
MATAVHEFLLPGPGFHALACMYSTAQEKQPR